MNNLVTVTLHGDLGANMGEHWNLCINSLSEAIRCIETNTKKLYKYLLEKDKENIKYQVIINGREIGKDKSITLEDNIKTIKESEFCINYKSLKTIDIVPVIEGNDSKTLGTIVGAILIVVGVVLTVFGFGEIGVPLIIAGLGIAVSSLLSKPPAFEDFREIEQGGKTSYLFSGPQNVIGEGGPVPIGYGRLIVGSQVISASYVIRDFNTANTSEFLRDEYGNLSFIPKKHVVNTYYGTTHNIHNRVVGPE